MIIFLQIIITVKETIIMRKRLKTLFKILKIILGTAHSPQTIIFFYLVP